MVSQSRGIITHSPHQPKLRCLRFIHGLEQAPHRKISAIHKQCFRVFFPLSVNNCLDSCKSADVYIFPPIYGLETIDMGMHIMSKQDADAAFPLRCSTFHTLAHTYCYGQQYKNYGRQTPHPIPYFPLPYHPASHLSFHIPTMRRFPFLKV